MEERQRGQESVERSHVSMQREWNAWRHEGRRRSSSRGSNGERHTAQSSDDEGLAAAMEESEKSGRESMTSFGSESDDGDVINEDGLVEEEEEERALSNGAERERERKRRRRWIDAMAAMANARMTAMMRMLGL